MRVRVDSGGECTATGAISGGCLERDVCERAQRVAATRGAILVTYDTMASDDIMWGSVLGCDGIVEMLLESLAGEAGEELMRFLFTHLERSARSHSDHLPRRCSETEGAAAQKRTRVMLDADGELIGGRRICHALVEDLHATMNTADLSVRGASCARSYGTPRGKVEALIECVEPPAAPVIFVAGADAVPVARLAHDTGMHVTVTDHRPACVTAERFPAAIRSSSAARKASHAKSRSKRTSSPS